MTQTFNGSSTFAFSSVGALIKASYDSFAAREVMSSFTTDSDGIVSDAVDLSSATLEVGEPNTAGYTKTWWYEINLLGYQPDQIRALVSGGSGSVALSIYSATSIDVGAGQEPAFTDLTLVTSGTDVTWTTDADADAYYVQVGLLSGAGTGWTFEWMDADPLDGGTYATALSINDEYGSSQVNILNAVQEVGEPDPVGISPIRTGWFVWASPTPSPGLMTFTLESPQTTGTFSIAAYTGAAVGSLTSVTSNVAAAGAIAMISFTPTAGVTYYLQAGTTVDRGTLDLAWTGPANIVAPATVYKNLRVEVWNKTGTVKITELLRRKNVQFQEVLNGVGMGSITVPTRDILLDPALASPFGNNLLATGNIVKFWLGSKCISGFQIRERASAMVSSGESSDEWTTVSGPTLNHLLSEFMILHEGGIRPGAPDTRAYSWASQPDEWYNATDWDDQYNTNPQWDPPGFPHRLPKRRPKYKKPKKWPDKKAKWMWISTKPSLNEGNYHPPRPMGRSHFFRKQVKITKNGQQVRLYVTGDCWIQLFINGDLVLDRYAGEKGYRKFRSFTTNLTAGVHTIGLHMRATNAASAGDKNYACRFTMMTLNEDGDPSGVLLRSNKYWQCYHGTNPPGWNRAMDIRNVVNEAKARGNEIAQGITLDFTKSVDTAGRGWPAERRQDSFKVGTSCLDLISQFAEPGNFDFWVNPDSMKLQAWNRRGTDKSKSVALSVGYNLLDFSVNEKDEVKNYFLVQYDGGFFVISSARSIARYGRREAYVELGGIRYYATARALMNALIAGIDLNTVTGSAPDVVAKPERERRGSLMAVEGAFPFLDFDIGDQIMAPDADRSWKRYRVLSLTCNEGDDGTLTFDPELQSDPTLGV
jgi:hypothetical protein